MSVGGTPGSDRELLQELYERDAAEDVLTTLGGFEETDIITLVDQRADLRAPHAR